MKKIINTMVFAILTMVTYGQPIPPESAKVQLKHLSKQLDLNPQQSESINKILKENEKIFRQQLEEVRKERQAFDEKMKKLKKDTDTNILKLLDDDQKEMFNEMIDHENEFVERRQSRPKFDPRGIEERRKLHGCKMDCSRELKSPPPPEFELENEGELEMH